MISLLRRFVTIRAPKHLKNVLSNRQLYSNSPILSETSKPVVIQYQQKIFQIVRYKSKKGHNKEDARKQEQSGSETETGDEKWDEQIYDKNTKVMQVVVGSLRIDALLKAALGMARNKVEALFYESKIRLNGHKLLKKSESAKEGDEIDVIRGPSVNNPDFLTVARVEVLEVKAKGDGLAVKLRRCKNLTVENYEGHGKKQ